MPQPQPDLKDFFNIAKQSLAYYKEHKPEMQAQAVQDRKRNFKGGFIFLFVALVFLALGYFLRGRMFFVYWYIWMGFSVLLVAAGVFNIFSNARLIMR